MRKRAAQKFISPTARVLCAVLGLLSVLFAAPVAAQIPVPTAPGLGMAPPGPVVARPPTPGIWYIAAGTKFRQIQRVSFDKTGTSGGFSVPFGPAKGGFFGSGGNTPGYPQTPTGVATDPPQTSGIWIYNDGLINPNNPNKNGTYDPNNPNKNQPATTTVTDILGTTTTIITSPGDQSYDFVVSPLVGSFLWPYTNPQTGVTNYGFYNQGSFFVSNLRSSVPPNGFTQFGQYDHNTNTWTADPTSFGATTTYVKYDLNINDQQTLGNQPPTQPPLLPTVGDDGFGPVAFDNWLWTPYLEIGLRSSPYYDVFCSFSVFNFGNHFGRSVPAWLYPVAKSITDYYLFTFNKNNGAGSTNQSQNFSSIRVGSALTINDDLNTYTLNPNFAYRQFNAERFDPATPEKVLTPANPELVTEHISVGLNATNIENRLGGRSYVSFPWFRDWPQWELGVSLGGVASMVYFRVETKTTLHAVNDPTSVRYAWSGGQSDHQWSWGGFAGIDLRMQLRNTFFGCAFDYAYMTDIRYSVNDIQAFINPGGKSLSLYWAMRF